MKDNSPHVTASGMPRSARAIESNTATMSPNTVVTSRYCRVPQAKRPRASAILGRSAAMEATRSPAPPVSTLRNSSSASRNTKLDASPATLLNSAPITPANLPRFSELAACLSCSDPTPSSASLAVAEFTRPSAFDAYWGSSVPRRASEKMIPRASASRIPSRRCGRGGTAVQAITWGPWAGSVLVVRTPYRGSRGRELTVGVAGPSRRGRLHGLASAGERGGTQGSARPSAPRRSHVSFSEIVRQERQVDSSALQLTSSSTAPARSTTPTGRDLLDEIVGHRTLITGELGEEAGVRRPHRPAAEVVGGSG